MSDTPSDKVREIFEDIYQNIGLLKAITDKQKLLEALKIRVEMLEDRVYHYDRCRGCLKRYSSGIKDLEIEIKRDGDIVFSGKTRLCADCYQRLKADIVTIMNTKYSNTLLDKYREILSQQ